MPLHKYIVTADAVAYNRHTDRVLLITRGGEPFKGKLAIPGGLLDPEDPGVAFAAKRELQEEAGLDISVNRFKFVCVQDRIDRDSRGRCLGFVYVAYVSQDEMKDIKAGDDAAEVHWVYTDRALEMDLAFDHNEILRKALSR